MSNFTPMAALLGGALIGGAALLLWLGLGRVAGIAGILGGLARARGAEAGWRLAFLAGLVLAPLAFVLLGGAVPAPRIEASAPVLVLAGLLVGFGTRLGNGCTSGHGVCGVARLSLRSVAATLVFMVVAALTVFVRRHLVGG